MSETVMLPPIDFKLDDTPHEVLKHLLYTMMVIREFEETVADLVGERKITTPCHLYTGQEAVATGICTALNQDDYVFGNHRSHGHYIAKGGDVNAAMAEIFCKATGCSYGRGGSMHLCAPEVGIMGTSSIVSGSMAIAVGTALAESIRGTGRITAVFHGDGVPEEGIWHESANLAGLKHLPIIFACENNLYCTHMALDKRRAYDNLSSMAREHGFNSTVVDGNNVLDVYYASKNAVDLIRSGQGPVFIEARTYRWRGHVGPNYDVDLGLRSQSELEAWIERCPIKHYSRFLIDQGIVNFNEMEDLSRQVRNTIAASVDYAIASPYPEVSEMTKHLFKGENVWE